MICYTVGMPLGDIETNDLEEILYRIALRPEYGGFDVPLQEFERVMTELNKRHEAARHVPERLPRRTCRHGSFL